jgi:cytoskeleton protein RodZ
MRVFGFLLLLLLVGASLYWWQERSGRDDAAVPVSALERIEVESADGTTQVHVLEDPDDQEVDEGALPLSPAPATDEAEVLAVPGAVEELANDQAQAASAEAAVEPSSVESSAVDSPSQAVAPQPAEQAEAASPAQADTAEAEGAQRSGAAQLEDGEGRLELRFVADCWVRVTAADGRQLLSTVGKAGSERTVVGTAPLNVHLGFARGAVLTYNGNPVDVSPFIRGETARLTLGQ